MIYRSGSRIHICRTIAAPTGIVWNILCDTRKWPAWGPSVLQVDCEERHIGIGSQGRVRTWFAVWLPFKVTDYRPLESWDWSVGTIQATGHSIYKKDEQSCVLCFDMPLLAFFYLPVCWLALKRIAAIALEK